MRRGTWGHLLSFCVAGVALGDMDLHFVCGRRGTYGTGLALVTCLVGAGSGVAPRLFCVAGVALGDICRVALTARAWSALGPVSFCVARVALGDMDFHFVLTRLVGAGSGLAPRLFCVAGVALGDICRRFVWQVWHSVTWTFTFCGSTYGTGLALVTRLVGAGSGVAPWQAWHLATSADVANGEEKTAGSALVSVDADPMVWDILEANLAKHKCNAQVVRGTVGSKSFKIITPEDEYKHLKHLEGYARFTADANDPRPGILVPAHSLQSLNVTFDTLAIDCEGCFAAFLEENPELLQSLTMIIVEAHGLGGEDKVVAKLQSEGWELRHKIMDQRVLCKGPCESFCDLDWVEAHARKYYGKRFV
eukprot:s761_g20.t1